MMSRTRSISDVPFPDDYVNDREFKRRTTEDILSLVDQLEETLLNTRRIKEYVAERKGSRYHINKGVDKHRGKSLTKEGQPEVRLPGILRNSRESKTLETTGDGCTLPEGPNRRYSVMRLPGILRNSRESKTVQNTGDGCTLPEGPNRRYSEMRLPGILRNSRESKTVQNTGDGSTLPEGPNRRYSEMRLPGILRNGRESKTLQNTGDGCNLPEGPNRRYPVTHEKPQENQEDITIENKIMYKSNAEDGCSYVDYNMSNPEVKWHKGEPDFIFKNASRIGYTKAGTPLYAGRTWDEHRSFLVPAYVNFEEGKCYFGKDGELWSSTSFEVMECRTLAWDDAKGTPVTELPKFAYKVGYNERDEPLYFGRAFIDGAVTPGYVEEVEVADAPNNRAYALILPFRGNILKIYDTYEVMLVLPLTKC